MKVLPQPSHQAIEEQGNDKFEEILTALKMFSTSSSSTTSTSSSSPPPHHPATPFGRPRTSPIGGDTWKRMSSRRIFEPINHKPSEMDVFCGGLTTEKAAFGVPPHPSIMGKCDFEDWNREDFGHTIAMQSRRRSRRNTSALSLALSRRTNSLDVELGRDQELFQWGAPMPDMGESRRSHSLGVEFPAPLKTTSIGFSGKESKKVTRAKRFFAEGSSLLGVSELGIANASNVWLSTAGRQNSSKKGEAGATSDSDVGLQEERKAEGFVDRHGVRWVGDCSFLEVMRSKSKTSMREGEVAGEETEVSGEASVDEKGIEGLRTIRNAMKRTKSERIIRKIDRGFSGGLFRSTGQQKGCGFENKGRGSRCEGLEGTKLDAVDLDLEYSSAGESDESKIRVPSLPLPNSAARQLKRVMSCPGRSCWDACSGYTKRTREKHCQVWGIKQFCDSTYEIKNDGDNVASGFGKERNTTASTTIGRESEKVPIFETAWEEEYPLECQPPCSEEGDRSMDDLGDTFQSELLDFWPSDMSLCDQEYEEEEVDGLCLEATTPRGGYEGHISTHSDFGNDHCRGDVYDMDNLGQIGAFRHSPPTNADNNCLVDALSNKPSVDSEPSGVDSSKVVEESFRTEEKEKEEESRGVRDRHGVLWVGDCDTPSILMGSPQQEGKKTKRSTRKQLVHAPDRILEPPLLGRKRSAKEKGAGFPSLGLPSKGGRLSSRPSFENILDSAECHKCNNFDSLDTSFPSGKEQHHHHKEAIDLSPVIPRNEERELVGEKTDDSSGNWSLGSKVGTLGEIDSQGFFQPGGEGGCPASWPETNLVSLSLVGCGNARGTRNHRLNVGAENGDFRASAALESGADNNGEPVGLTALESRSTHGKLNKEACPDSGNASDCGSKHPLEGMAGAAWSLGVFMNPHEKSTKKGQELCRTKSLYRRLLEYCSESLRNGVGSSCRNLGNSIWECTSRKKGAVHRWGANGEKNAPRSVASCMSDPPFLIRF